MLTSGIELFFISFHNFNIELCDLSLLSLPFKTNLSFVLFAGSSNALRKYDLIFAAERFSLVY